VRADTELPLDAELERLVDDAAALLDGRSVAVLTGAGISTDSGIPDYRGPDSPPRRPMTYQQFVSDPAYRRTYWARNHIGMRFVRATGPNGGHLALAQLERSGTVIGLITQNVDLLHTRAGSQRVIDLHGTYAWVVCLGCGLRSPREELAARLQQLNPDVGAVADVEIAPDADAVIESTEGFRVADCESCGGILKPDIVYFGENVPAPRVAAAYAVVDAADVLLVAGSSLTVMSGYRFVRHAAATGRAVVIVNRGATRGDAQADLRSDAGCTPILARLAQRVRRPDGALSAGA
jgi:NAD-dependent SIR2 family protein deacetylase